jgi:hypothetical protein
LSLEQRALAPVVGRESEVGTDGAAEQAVGQRPVDEHAEVVLGAVREDLAFDLAAEEVIGRLERLDGVGPRERTAASKFDTPTWRILPASTSSDR